MISAVCTLFEGHYHYGVATLSNSLYTQGFRGTIYVGYRGSLPNWILKGKKESVGKWKEAISVSPVEGIQLVFLQLATTYSLTNYKPDFMLELWEGAAKDADALFYFDPDIVVIDSWKCFEQWVDCGVAVCEDINSPLQEFHPRRHGWRNYFKNYDIDLQYKNQIYVNGGFVGLSKKNISFLKLWIKLQESMGDAIGGLDKSIFFNQTHNSTILKMEGFQFFDKSDQDALNATIEAYDGAISYIGKDGMGFIPGEATMIHALGSLKPWRINHFIRFFKGRIPRREDVVYWENSKSPILAHSRGEIRKKQMAIKISKFLGRFYRV
ncbi:hypothetical protein ACHRVZ_20810 [Flavobacterium sp. FlaQc-57]|uniref:hypothetical protein n=1 Tax=Flavobacterium sp. FlaQc-57 TaxID=3374186 RepID=UPI003756D105